MNTTQTIIVYRNPVEAMFWDNIMNTNFGNLVPIVAGMFVSIVTIVILSQLSQRKYGFRVPEWVSNGILAIGAVAGVAVSYMMWI